jgi:amino acid transporter
MGRGTDVQQDAATMAAGHDGSASETGGLQAGALPLPAVIAQSVSGMGLSGIVALLVPLVAVQAGAGGWLTWLICTVLITGVAVCLSALTRRITTTGGLYGLAAASLGSFGAAMSVWTMLLLVGIASLGSGVIGCGIYFAQFLELFGLPDNGLVLALCYVVALAVAWWAAYAGVRRSAWVMLSVEAIATLAITVLMVATLVSHDGSLVDARQLRLEGTSAHAILQAAVLAVLAFGGFESASVFGREARNPRRAIPVAMTASVLFAGVLWIFSGYTLYLGFQGSGYDLAHSDQPLHDLAAIAGIPWFSYVVDLAISTTLLTSAIAIFNGVSRLMLTAAHEGLAPADWRHLHPRYQTPDRALNVLAACGGAVLAGVIISGIGPFAIFGDLGDLDGFAYLTLYSLVCLGSIAFLRRRGALRTRRVVVALLSAGGLVYVFYSNVVPWPAWPENLLLAIALGVIGLSLAGFVLLRTLRPDLLRRAGSTVDG